MCDNALRSKGSGKLQVKGAVTVTLLIPLCAWAALLAVCSPQPAGAQEPEPIAAAGHGGFFGPDGRQVPVSLNFAAQTQRWYRNKLLSALPTAARREFAAYDKRLKRGLDPSGQDRLVLQHQALVRGGERS